MRKRVGNEKANCFESVNITIGGATKFRTLLKHIKPNKHIIEIVIAAHKFEPINEIMKLLFICAI